MSEMLKIVNGAAKRPKVEDVAEWLEQRIGQEQRSAEEYIQDLDDEEKAALCFARAEAFAEAKAYIAELIALRDERRKNFWEALQNVELAFENDCPSCEGILEFDKS